jgi:hypothetical protein
MLDVNVCIGIYDDDHDRGKTYLAAARRQPAVNITRLTLGVKHLVIKKRKRRILIKRIKINYDFGRP